MNKKDWLAFSIFAALVAIAFAIIGSLDKTGESEETLLVRNAVKRAAVSCYATEGFYPEELDYLQKNYGFSYDSSRYAVFYDSFASNLMPVIRVVKMGESTP